MAVQKNFVVHNGLEVNDNLIYADSSTDRVGIRTTSPEYVLDVKGGIGVKDLKVTGITTVNNVEFQGKVTVGSTTGNSGQYLISTGTGVTWGQPPNTREVTSITATSNQSVFNLSYNIGFIDVYINGIRLSDSEYSAIDGFTITLDTPCFGDETVDFITYRNTTAEGLQGITIQHDNVLVGTAGSTVLLNFTGNAVDVNATGVAATITINQEWISTTAGIHTLSNVGIGTTNPQFNLDVLGNVRVAGILTASSFVGDGSGLTNLPIGSSSQWITTAAGIHTLSNVGVGTTNPTTKLEIEGNLKFLDNNAKIGDVTVGESLTPSSYTWINRLVWENGTTIVGEANNTYNLTGVSGNLNGTNLIIDVYRDSGGSISTVAPGNNGDGNFVYNEQITVLGSLIGGIDGIDDLTVIVEESYQNGTGNLFVGKGAGRNTTSGGWNNFLGEFSGYKNTTGKANNFFGFATGKNNIDGTYNNFFGGYSGYYNTSGCYNNFFGCCAGGNNTTGSYNNFFGQSAGINNTTGSYNNFFGLNAGYNNTTGDSNHFIGYQSGYCNTTGSLNVSIGDYNYGSTTGCGNFLSGYAAGYGGGYGMNDSSFNNFIGWYAGGSWDQGNSYCNNFIGYYAGACNCNSYNNNFFGSYAGYNNTTGCGNNFIGRGSGFYNTTGYYNNFFGAFSGHCNTTGGYNSFFGQSSGYCNTTGFNNAFFGSYSGCGNITGCLNIFVGSYNGISTSASNKIVIGSATFGLGGFDAPDITKDTQLAIGIKTDANPANYWLVGDENFNIGIGTTNPTSKLDVGGTVTASSLNVTGTTRITGFIESQNTSTNTNNILSLDAAQGTVFTHTTTANIGIVSFTGISTSKANTQTFTVLVTQGAVGYNTTAATGIGTQLATIVTEGGVGYSTHIKVGSGTTITLTSTPGALDILTFIVSYNGVGIASTSFTVIGMNAQNFRGVI